MAFGTDPADPILVKQNDTRPKIRVFATQGVAKTPVDLTGSTAVFNMRSSTNPNTVVVSRAPATVLSGTGGGLEYVLTAAQTANVGTFQAEFEVTLSDGGVLTFPSGDQYVYIKVGDDIA